MGAGEKIKMGKIHEMHNIYPCCEMKRNTTYSNPRALLPSNKARKILRYIKLSIFAVLSLV